jgi:hypothetical protein
MRSTFITFAIGIIAVAVSVWFFSRDTVVPAPVVEAPVVKNSSTDVSFVELANGDRSKVTTRVNYLIKSSSELTELWKMIDASGQPPDVDFKTDSVIAIFAGKKPTDGYSIAVSGVEDSGSRKVSITLTNPGGSCLPAQIETSPYQIVEFPKTALPLTHEDTTATASCLR